MKKCVPVSKNKQDTLNLSQDYNSFDNGMSIYKNYYFTCIVDTSNKKIKNIKFCLWKAKIDDYRYSQTIYRYYLFFNEANYTEFDNRIEIILKGHDFFESHSGSRLSAISSTNFTESWTKYWFKFSNEASLNLVLYKGN